MCVKPLHSAKYIQPLSWISLAVGAFVISCSSGILTNFLYRYRLFVFRAGTILYIGVVWSTCVNIVFCCC